MTDRLPQFNRISFITLNSTRLFTAEQICEIVEYYCEREREKMLGILAGKLRSGFSIDENEEYWLSYIDFESVINESEEELRKQGDQG